MDTVLEINNFTFLWSIYSTLIGVILALVSVGLLVKSIFDARNEKRQVKIWMQYANGLSESLKRVVSDNLSKRYSSTDDMANAIFSLQSLAFGLYQSLYEERCVKEKEFIKQQKKLRDKIETDLNNPNHVNTTPPSPIVPPVNN